MWTRRISSQTPEYPTPQDVFRALLVRTVEEGSTSSWAHFEVIAPGGWFNNLLHGKEPVIEVAYEDAQLLQLIPIISKSKRSAMPGVPETWQPDGKRMWVVPLADVDELIAWINECLIAVSQNPSYRVTGWIEG